MSERIGRYLTVGKVDLPGRKTTLWQIRSNDDDILGMVSWDTPWRTYTFNPSEGTIYSAGCLADIKVFLDKCNGKGV